MRRCQVIAVKPAGCSTGRLRSFVRLLACMPAWLLAFLSVCPVHPSATSFVHSFVRSRTSNHSSVSTGKIALPWLSFLALSDSLPDRVSFRENTFNFRSLCRMVFSLAFSRNEARCRPMRLPMM